jgi:Holliday junction resolvase RusA-like endonuclease
VAVPLRVCFPRKTKKDVYKTLNMNEYRNWDWRVASTAKKNYHEEVKSLFEGLQIQTPVKVTFQMFKKTKIRTDKSNFYAVITKFLFDTLTEVGFWEDDNDDYVKEELLLPTEHDKENPRAVFIFETIEEE